MAAKTGFSGLVALALLFNSSIVSAVTTASENWMMKPHHASTTVPTASATGTAAAAATLNATVVDCFLTLPNNALSAQGLSTPFQLNAPCSMSVSTQRAFAEAAVFDPATGAISIYHPLIIDAGKTPKIAPVVPALPNGAVVALWFGFNGATLQLLDTAGADANASPQLKGIGCVNGLPGVKGDVFGQVSWCNTVPFFTAADASITAGTTVIPPLGTDKNGQTCPSSRSFTIVDACPSDNLPTQYLLLADNTTVQDTAANRAAQPAATVLDNASDEALIGHIVDPLIGCSVFQVASLDDPGALVGSLATQELQARQFQQAPIANVPMNDPDCLLTASGATSVSKTNAYRLGVNQVPVSQDPGNLDPYCTNMITIAPPFLKINQATFTGATTPDPNVGSNLFTFLCNRYLTSLTMLKCPPNPAQPIACKLNGNGAATSCTINIALNSTTAGAAAGAGTGAAAKSTAGAAGAGTGGKGGKATSTLSTVTAAKSAVASMAAGANGQNGNVGTNPTGLGLPGAAAGTGAVGAAHATGAIGAAHATGAIGAVNTAVLNGQGTAVAQSTCTCTCMAAAKAGAKVKRVEAPEIEAPAPVPAPHFGRRSIRRTVDHFPFA